MAQRLRGGRQIVKKVVALATGYSNGVLQFLEEQKVPDGKYQYVEDHKKLSLELDYGDGLPQ